MAEKEYIDRNELIDDFQNDLINLHFDGLKGTPRPKEIKIVNVIERIEDFPAADITPVKSGFWEPISESEMTGFNPEFAGCDPIAGYKCSNCGNEAIFSCNDEFVLSDYCPDCGAKMDGGDNNG